MKQYLLIFAHEHIDFRLPELKCLLSLLNIKAEYDESSYDGQSPFLPIKFESEESAKQLMSRTMLGRSLVELWGHGSSRDEAGHMIEKQWKEEWLEFCHEDVSFCFRVNTFGKQFNIKEKIVIMEEIAKYLPLEGPVNLNHPDQLFHMYEFYGMNPNDAPELPYEVYVGRWIADGQRYLAHKYSIKTRHFIGNTSMDATLALIMANMAKVTRSMMVFDPFVGTGSLLVGAAHFGAYTLGSDINSNVIHGQGKTSRCSNDAKKNKMRGDDENIRANMRQYGLENHYLDVLVTDFSRNVWRQQPMFDAIITDPPYGLREATKKVGTEKSYKIWEEQVQQHIPATQGYGLGHILIDLIDFATQFLRLHGRLVFWMPVAIDDYTDDMVPQHPCFRLVANSEQALTSKMSRRLITMEKCKSVEDLQGIELKAVIKDNKYEDFNSLRDKVFNLLPNQKSETETTDSAQANGKESAADTVTSKGGDSVTDTSKCNGGDSVTDTSTPR